MACQECDGRFNCSTTISSACVDYTGKVSKLVKDTIPCKPNVNDVIESSYKLLEVIKKSLGDNRLLDEKCLSFNNLIVTQEELNQIFIDKICEFITLLNNVSSTISIDASRVFMEINLLCIESGLCTPQVTYTLSDILNKMVLKICDHETRITAIETFLGL